MPVAVGTVDESVLRRTDAIKLLAGILKGKDDGRHANAGVWVCGCVCGCVCAVVFCVPLCIAVYACEDGVVTGSVRVCQRTARRECPECVWFLW